MRIHFNKILATLMIINGQLTATHVSKKMIDEDPKAAKSLEATAARVGVTTAITYSHLHLANKLWNNDKLVVEIGKKKSDADHLHKRVLKVRKEFCEGKLKPEDAVKKVYKYFNKYPTLTVAERALLVGFLAQDEELIRILKENEPTFYTMVIGPADDEKLSQDQVTRAYRALRRFSRATDTFLELIDSLEVSVEDKENIHQQILAIGNQIPVDHEHMIRLCKSMADLMEECKKELMSDEEDPEPPVSSLFGAFTQDPEKEAAPETHSTENPAGEDAETPEGPAAPDAEHTAELDPESADGTDSGNPVSEDQPVK